MTSKTQAFKLRKPIRNIIVRFSLIITIAILLGYIHYSYVWRLFENDRNFSYLSRLEREMSLRTEMGFYYSYYKIIVEERPILAGINKIFYDKLVEYPNEINAINRFNIYPEIVLGLTYSYLEKSLNTTTHRQCYMIDRGNGRAPIESCVGLGEPAFFYLEVIWWLAGFLVSVLFLHATLLSGSVFGGALAILQYFSNHAECTRVQWAPNERENFAMPFLMMQAFLVTLQLRGGAGRTSLFVQISSFTLNCICLICWQFTQFIFLTQLAILFVMEQLRIINLGSLSIFLHAHFCGLHMAILFLQGNNMLKSSLYSSFFISLVGYCFIFKFLKITIRTKWDVLIEIWLIMLRISIVTISSLYIKKVINEFLNAEEDSHIWDILYAKLTNFKSFHTMIYTCSDVFNFLPWSSFWRMTKTSLIPLNLIVIMNFIWCTFNRKKAIAEDNRKVNIEDDGGTKNAEIQEKYTNLDELEKRGDKFIQNEEIIDDVVVFLRSLQVDAALFYNIAQMCVYSIMAWLVMRLKLLFTTQMCLLSSMAMNLSSDVFPEFLRTKRSHLILWACVIPHLIIELHKNVMQESSHIGEFSDAPLEELLGWINSHTNAKAVFAASMPLSASVMLATRRAVVCHPHYEHGEARRRAYTVYKMYGKFPSQHLYEELTHLKANHLIVENKYCYGRSNKGCTFKDIWDIEYPHLKFDAHLCHTLLNEAVPHFYPVFLNEEYAVFNIHDLSIRYMPRSFAT